ncbi:MAG TPA: TonB family protein, partial [Blastocatellia bacterium]|nr:TonB family protein [Blastocatellia bacterium]
MFKAVFVAIAAVMLVWSAPVAAQQKRVAVGPVVRAFLTGLDEDLTELEFQIRHNEISRKDYERTKQRLIVLKRFVERSSALNPEDRVPELQVLADDELIALNPGAELNLNDLKIGAQASARWKLVGIERVRERFFVLEKLPPSETTSLLPERKLPPGIDWRDVVETIVARVESSEPTPQSLPITVVPTVAVEVKAATPAETVSATVAKPKPAGPRLLHIYLPEYTDKAREKKIEGELIVRALFGRDGKVRNIKVEKSLGYGLDDRAVAAVRRLGFLPAEVSGREVDASAQIVFSFT